MTHFTRMGARIGTRRMVVAAAAAGVVAGLVAAVPGAAFAAPSANSAAGSTPPTTQASNPLCSPAVFGPAQQRVEADLAAPVTQLNALSAAVNNNAHKLTAGDRQTLQNDIVNVELPGIEALQTRVPQDTTCPQLRTDA